MANTITTGKISSSQANFNITNIIGVDVGNAYPVYSIPGSSASGTQLFYPETNNPPFALGTHVLGTNNSEYVMCVVGTAGSINQYDLVSIDQNYNVQQMTSTLAAAGNMLGFNQNNTPGTATSVAGIAASQASVNVNFCWIAIRGDQLLVNTATLIGAGAVLYVGSTAGTIGSATASTELTRGVYNVASVTAATVMAVIAQFPGIGVFGN